MLVDKLNAGGEVLFFSGSFAYDKAEGRSSPSNFVEQRPSAGRPPELQMLRKRSEAQLVLLSIIGRTCPRHDARGIGGRIPNSPAPPRTPHP